MTFKASFHLADLVRDFKLRFIIVLICVLFIVYRTAGKVYQQTGHYNFEFWISISAMFIILNLVTIAFFRSDFDLINGAVSQFSITDDRLMVVTSALNFPLLLKRAEFEVTLTMHQFSRDKTIFPIRMFPFLKYSCWEIRTDDGKTVYIINQFFETEAIVELEKFLYWKDISKAASTTL